MWENKEQRGTEFSRGGHQFFDPLLSYFQMREPDEAVGHAVAFVADRIKHWPASACLELADSESLPQLVAEPGWPLVRSLQLDFGTNLDVVESLVTSSQCQNLEHLALTGEEPLASSAVERQSRLPKLSPAHCSGLYVDRLAGIA